MNMRAELNKSVHMLALAGPHTRYPQTSEAKIRRRLAGLFLGEESAGNVCGNRPAPLPGGFWHFAS